MRWDSLLFLHWPIHPDAIRPLIPDPLEVDLYGGSAWVALVPFRMEATRFRGYPPLPGLSSFYECNVRTYVRARNALGNDVSGVWFFSLDAERLLPVLGGNWLWSLNYVHSRFRVRSTHTGSGEIDSCDYALWRRRDGRERARVEWTRGAPVARSVPGSIEHFLTERYWLFTMRRGLVMGGRIEHEPWSLRRASVSRLEDTLVPAAGLRVDGEPLAWHSDSIDVCGWNLVRMDQA